MEKALFYKDIILKHKQSIVKSRADCDVSSVIAGKRVSVPVFCSNMPSVLTYDIVKQFDKADWFHVWHRNSAMNDFEENGFTPIQSIKTYLKRANKDNLNFVSISIGVKEEDLELLGWILSEKYRVDAITIDVALIYNKHFEGYLKEIRELFPKTYLIAGNCDSGESVKWLEDLGYDAVKFGIGTSTVCRTRQYTGVGTASVTDLINIDKIYNSDSYSPIKWKRKIKVIQDGGATVDENGEVWLGDIAKSQRFGADFFMSGKIFANCIDSPALLNGYSGNSTARIKGHSNNVEGATLIVKSNGLTIKQMMKLIEDSLRSSVSYAGGNTLEALKLVDYQIVS